MLRYGTELGDWKTAELGAEELIASAKNDREMALPHYDLAQVLMNEGLQKHKEEYFARSHEKCAKAIPDKGSPVKTVPASYVWRRQARVFPSGPR